MRRSSGGPAAESIDLVARAIRGGTLRKPGSYLAQDRQGRAPRRDATAQRQGCPRVQGQWLKRPERYPVRCLVVVHGVAASARDSFQSPKDRACRRVQLKGRV
jgi:hypothetical protein